MSLGTGPGKFSIFTKNLKKIIGFLVIPVMLVIAGFGIYNLLQQQPDIALASTVPVTNFNQNDCTTYATNGGTNTDGVCFVKLYEKSGTLYRQLDISPGELVNVRLYYNNNTTSSVTAASITDGMPVGFINVGDINNTYVTPPDYNWQPSNEVTLTGLTFSGQNLTTSPGAGFFGYAYDATTSNLELGRTKYIINDDCGYTNNLTSFQTFYNKYSPVTAQNTIPLGIGCDLDAFLPNPNIFAGSSSGGNNYIQGHRYFHLPECDYSYLGGYVVGNNTLAFSLFPDNSSTATVDCFSTYLYPYPSNPILVNTNIVDFDLLGNRYFHLGECEYANSSLGLNRAFNRTSTTNTADNNPTLTPNCDNDPYDSSGAISTFGTDIDMSDTTRGYGYISYTMQTPSSGLTNGQQFGEDGQMVGTTSGVQTYTSDKTNSLTVINGNTPNPPIQNSNIASLVCSPSTTAINTTVNCAITTTVNLNTLSGSVNVRIGAGGSVVNCSVTGSGFTLNCNFIPVGNTEGTFASQYNASGSGVTYANGNNITVGAAPLCGTGASGTGSNGNTAITDILLCITAGNLILTSPVSASFTSLTVSDVEQNSAANLTGITVEDLRGSEAGWSLACKSSNLTGVTFADTVIPVYKDSSSKFNLTPSALQAVGVYGSTQNGLTDYTSQQNTTSVSSSGSVGESNNFNLAAFASGYGVGKFNKNLLLNLTIPPYIRAQNYVGTLTCSVS
jgi:hypothetical protein